MDDTPRIWQDETEEDQLDQSQELAVIEQEPPVPSIEVQSQIVADSSLKPESKSLLNSLIEMNNIGETLMAIRSNETQEQRKTVLTVFCEAFVKSRMSNNAVAEQLKAKLLERLINNVDNLDLEATARIYNDLTETSNTDAQQALANVMGGGTGIIGGGSGTTVNLNLATGENGMVQALNVGGNNNPQPIQSLKETATLNAGLKAWGNIPALPKKKEVIDITPDEK